MDRGYQSHAHFDQWQTDEKQFVCRIKEDTTRTVIKEYAVPEKGVVFFYYIAVLLGAKSTKPD
jgi:hypothetical protein